MELSLVGLVAVDEGGAELARAVVDVLEELLARGGLADLVGDRETGANTNNEQQDVLHFTLLKRFWMVCQAYRRKNGKGGPPHGDPPERRASKTLHCAYYAAR